MKLTSVLAIGLSLNSFLWAQAPQPQERGRGRGANAATAKPSYEVHPDRTVTLQLQAPNATDVKLSGDFIQGQQQMTKGEDGAWSITVGPLQPSLYNYSFIVNGVRIPDPVNPMVKLGDRTSESMFEVPAEKPAVYDIQPVPHGTVHINWYVSKTVEAPRSIYVYTPPGYEQGRATYPALYLLHGSGDTEDGWVIAGRANLILDNLIAAGKAKPMVVVMPYGRAFQEVYFGPGDRRRPPDPDAFAKDLLNDVVPYVEKQYRVVTKPDGRAIAGLSMGGSQTLQIGLSHLDTFHYIGAFSAGIRDAKVEEVYKDAFADPAATNKKMKLFYIACGKTDTLFASSQGLSDALDRSQIKHTFVPSEEGHVWRNWRNYLADFVPQLFR